MINPMMMADIAAKVTPPAEISLINPIFLWYSGWVKSHNFSMAVFKDSATRTMPIARICKIHSILEMSSSHPKMETQMAMNN